MIKLKFFVLLLPIVLFIYISGILMSEVEIEIYKANNEVYLSLDNKKIKLQPDAVNINRIIIHRQDKIQHEFQIDGSDSMNNYNYQENYFRNISGNFFYKIYDFLRGGDLYSSWKDVKIVDNTNGLVFFERKLMPTDREIDLSIFPDNSTIQIVLSYPEKPVKLSFITEQKNEYSISLNRNERYVKIIKYSYEGQSDIIADLYYPMTARPYIGENLVQFSRILLTAVLIIIITSAASMLTKDIFYKNKVFQGVGYFIMRLIKSMATNNLIIILIALSFLYVLFISHFLYQGMPHVLDAISYFNQAKIFASGQLYAQVTYENMLLGGPFMNAYNGKWFIVFGPGTSLLLSLGIFFKTPWLVMPVLGALSLIGIYLIGKKWYGNKIAIPALILLIFSPFYSFVAGSYLSHPASLFFLIFAIYFWNSFCRRLTENKTKYIMLILSAVFLGFAFLVREAVSVILGVYGILALLVVNYKAIIRNYKFLNLINFLVLYAAVFSIFPIIYFLYNRILTGSIFILPRWLFHSGDTYGFGDGIGFYGQHTPAAGLVILEQLLTSLQFELFGWIYPFTLAFIAVLFLLRRANKYDYVSLGFVVLIFAMHVPYYYHSIAIGPRHLYEALPFFAFLTARGIWALAVYTKSVGGGSRYSMWPLCVLVMSLFLYNMLFYTPRKIELYNRFAGLPSYVKLDTKSIYNNNLKNAVVLTDSWLYYFQVLSALNDPMGKGDVLYVYAPDEEVAKKAKEVYRTRIIYILRVDNDGRVYFDKIDN